MTYPIATSRVVPAMKYVISNMEYEIWNMDWKISGR
jgi:hypothetical protein